jgi:hypothetical protein
MISDAPPIELDTEDTTTAGFLFSLMQSLHSYTPPESKDVLQQLTDTNKKGPFFYWLLLVAHCLEKLHGNKDHSMAAAWLSYHAAVKLVASLPKLEKLNAARQVVGRFLLAMTMAASGALRELAQDLEATTTGDLMVMMASIRACIVAIDSATMLHHPTTVEDEMPQVWESVKESIVLLLGGKWNDEREQFRQLFQGEDVWTETEKTCWQALLEMEAAQPERIQRKRRIPVKTQYNDIAVSFAQLSNAATAAIDIRLALRRWTAVGLTFCKGQMAILEASLSILKNRQDESASRTVALVCRLCRIVWEAGNSAGARPPGGLEAYMKNPKEKPAKTDLRDIATVLSYELIRKHHEDCLKHVTTGLLLHGDSQAVASQDGRMKRLMPDEYYPFLHKVIHELANAAAANVAISSADQQKNIIDHIEFAAAAYTIQYQSRIWPSPLDVMLTKFSIGKLNSSLSENNQSAGFTASYCPPRESNTNQQSFTENLPWDQPLPVPSIRVAKQRSRKRKTTVDNNLDCTFAGIYSVSCRVEPSCDEKFSLFARAMIRNKKHQRSELFSSLASHLIAILERCYDSLDSSAVPDDSLLPPEEKKRKPSNEPCRSSKRRKNAGKKAKLRDISGDIENSSAFR